MAATTTALLIRYPEFQCVSPPRIQIALDDAARRVDDDWLDADRDRAQIALAAHILTTEGALSAAGGPTTTRGPIVSEKIGDASWSFGRLGTGASGQSSGSSYATTAYGQTYLDLLRLNVPGVAIV